MKNKLMTNNLNKNYFLNKCFVILVVVLILCIILYFFTDIAFAEDPNKPHLRGGAEVGNDLKVHFPYVFGMTMTPFLLVLLCSIFFRS